MTPDIAISWNRYFLIWGRIFKDFKDRDAVELEEMQLLHDGPRMHIQMFLHPVFITLKRTKGVHIFAT